MMIVSIDKIIFSLYLPLCHYMKQSMHDIIDYKMMQFQTYIFIIFRLVSIFYNLNFLLNCTLATRK